MTPLLSAVWFSGANSKKRWLRDLQLGYIAGLVFFTVVFSWLSALGSLFQNLALYGLPALLAIYLGLYLALWACLAGLLRPVESPDADKPPALGKWDEMLTRAGKPMPEAPGSPWLKSSTNLRLALCLAAFWVVEEWIRGWLFGGFGWNGLGVALHSNWAIIQIAEYTGVGGLSFVVAFANVIAVASVRRFMLEARTHKMRPHYDLTLTMAAIVGLLGFGLRSSQSRGATTRIRVAAIQANVPQREKFDPEFTSEIFEKFAHLSEIAMHTAPQPDLVVWPESSMPDPARERKN